MGQIGGGRGGAEAFREDPGPACGSLGGSIFWPNPWSLFPLIIYTPQSDHNDHNCLLFQPKRPTKAWSVKGRRPRASRGAFWPRACPTFGSRSPRRRPVFGAGAELHRQSRSALRGGASNHHNFHDIARITGPTFEHASTKNGPTLQHSQHHRTNHGRNSRDHGRYQPWPHTGVEQIGMWTM